MFPVYAVLRAFMAVVHMYVRMKMSSLDRKHKKILTLCEKENQNCLDATRIARGDHLSRTLAWAEHCTELSRLSTWKKRVASRYDVWCVREQTVASLRKFLKELPSFAPISYLAGACSVLETFYVYKHGEEIVEFLRPTIEVVVKTYWNMF